MHDDELARATTVILPRVSVEYADLDVPMSRSRLLTGSLSFSIYAETGVKETIRVFFPSLRLTERGRFWRMLAITQCVLFIVLFCILATI